MGAVSEQAKANKRKYYHDLYEWYKAQGICTRCRTRYAEPGRTCCAECLKRYRNPPHVIADPDYRKNHCKARRARLKAEGLCVSCGAKPPEPGRVLCAECARKNNEAGQVRRIKKKLAKQHEKLMEALKNGKET